jgi:hypothetical protein
MERVVGFVDFGFLKAAARRPLQVDPERLSPKPQGIVAWLWSLQPKEPAAVLRASWYDGAYDARHSRHNAQRKYLDTIAAVPGIQLRLGHLQETKPKWQYASIAIELKQLADQVVELTPAILRTMFDVAPPPRATPKQTK